MRRHAARPPAGWSAAEAVLHVVGPDTGSGADDVLPPVPPEEAAELVRAGDVTGDVTVGAPWVDGRPRYVWAEAPDGRRVELRLTGARDGEYEAYVLHASEWPAGLS